MFFIEFEVVAHFSFQSIGAQGDEKVDHYTKKGNIILLYFYLIPLSFYLCLLLTFNCRIETGIT